MERILIVIGYVFYRLKKYNFRSAVPVFRVVLVFERDDFRYPEQAGGDGVTQAPFPDAVDDKDPFYAEAYGFFHIVFKNTKLELEDLGVRQMRRFRASFSIWRSSSMENSAASRTSCFLR